MDERHAGKEPQVGHKTRPSKPPSSSLMFLTVGVLALLSIFVSLSGALIQAVMCNKRLGSS